MTFTGQGTFVKENHMLSRERTTVFTQVSSDPAININHEFEFTGKGSRTKLTLDGNVKYQWSVSGSYPEENMLKIISNLPSCFNPFTAVRKLF